MTEAKSELNEEDLKAVADVKARLKFFFSDANVRQDYFIRKHLLNDKGPLAQMVTIESLLRFNTIKQHTTKADVVVKAAKEMSDILTMDDETTAIGRVVPFTKEMMDGHVNKSLHLKDIPLKKKDGEDDSMEYAVTVNDIRAMFEKYGEVAMIKLKWSSNPEEGNQKKKSKRKYPTGCALVEFETEEALKAAAEATVTSKKDEAIEPKEKLVLADSQIQCMLLSEIIEKKKSESKKRKESGGSDDEDHVKVEPFTFDWKPGCVIKLSGVPADCDREALLDMLAAGMSISVEEVKDRKIYVDFSRGEKNGALRFPEPGDHIGEIQKKLSDGTLEVKGAKVEEARILDSEEEKKYWDDFIAFKTRQAQQRADEKRSRKRHRKY